MSTDPQDNTSTPNQADETQGRREDPQPAPDVATTAADGARPTQTQGNMGDGTGQRGGYGDSDQTNGMEGAADKPDAPAE